MNRLKKAARGTRELASGVHLGSQALVFDDIAKIAGDGDYKTFCEFVDLAMKEWGILPDDAGYVKGKLISDTKEIVFDPENVQFSIHTPFCGYFSGAPRGEIQLSDEISVFSKNERITLALIAKEEKKLENAEEYILTAMGTTGMDETEFYPGQKVQGMPFEFTAVEFKGKLYAETLEGVLTVRVQSAELEILNPVGERLKVLSGEKEHGMIRFTLDGSVPGIQYHLTIKR